MIELKNIIKFYNNKSTEQPALNNINLNINSGEIFGIIGKSGAGKITLLRTINLLEKPSSGTVSINGIRLSSCSKQQLIKQRNNIVFIFQHFNLLKNRTVAENIALPLELSGTSHQEQHGLTQDLLELVDLENFAERYPVILSGGQKQRVAIARAIANDPDIILCDEITAAFDPESTRNILQLLEKINKELKKTIV